MMMMMRLKGSPARRVPMSSSTVGYERLGAAIVPSGFEPAEFGDWRLWASSPIAGRPAPSLS